MSTAPPRLGPRYEPLALLGTGGFGQVWRVWDRQLGRAVALKILRPERAEGAGQLQHFLDEARMTARFQHPGVVVVHELEYLPEGRTGLVMQEVRGQTLRERLLQKAPLAALVLILHRVCQTVGYAHRQGIVHRDLKPANIMIDDAGAVMVVDWGMAGLKDQVSRRGGTPGFMSPEQHRGDPSHPTDDIFAVGCMLARILEQGAAPIPELHRLAEEACREIGRLASMDLFADRLEAWLLHTGRSEQAERLVQEADALQHRLSEARARHAVTAVEAGDEAVRLGPGVDPSERKHQWALEDRAEALAVEVAELDLRYQELLHSALQLSPTDRGAHSRLASYHHSAHVVAESLGDVSGARVHESRLRQHNLGEYDSYLSGEGVLELTSAEPVSVRLHRFEEVERRLRPVFVEDLGQTPIRRALPMGSYLLTINTSTTTTNLPVFIDRNRSIKHNIRENPATDERDIFVPEGWFIAGGAGHARPTRPRQWMWCHRFTMRRFPITNAEYLMYLKDLWFREGEEAVRAMLPPKSGIDLDPAPRLLTPEAARLPVVTADWFQARRFTAWLAEKTGKPWRLPVELEVEKAARGVDGRRYPWGRHFDPTWCRNTYSLPGDSTLGPIDAHPEDVSVYGVRGLAGNTKTWCSSRYDHPTQGDRVLVLDPGVVERETRMDVRGGSWEALFSFSQCAARYHAKAMSQTDNIGIHPVWSDE